MQNIAVIGGGPIGLLSALSLKWQNPDANIHVFEKHSKYTRTHTLKISLSSLNTIRPQAPAAQRDFDAMVAAIKKDGKFNKNWLLGHTINIKTNKLEDILVQYTQDNDITITHKEIKNYEQELANYEIVIGADGAKSNVRKFLCNNEEDNRESEMLQCMLQVKYHATRAKIIQKNHVSYKRQLMRGLAYFLAVLTIATSLTFILANCIGLITFVMIPSWLLIIISVLSAVNSSLLFNRTKLPDHTKPLSLGALGEKYRTQKLLNFFADEVVGKKGNTDTDKDKGAQEEGLYPVSLQFFPDKNTFKEIGYISAAKPKTVLEIPSLPKKMRNDITIYLNSRRKAGEIIPRYVKNDQNKDVENIRVVAIPLENFHSKIFAKHLASQKYYLVGDASGAVPYFRALNGGIAKIQYLLKACAEKQDLDYYNKAMLAHCLKEEKIAKCKYYFLKIINSFIQISGRVFWQTNRHSQKTIEEFKNFTNLVDSLPSPSSPLIAAR
jgi:hypothetical protein